MDDAPYFAMAGDPPATRAFRRAVSLLGEYIDVLLILAEGRNLDEPSAQVQTLGGRIAALIALAPGAGTMGAGLTGALGALAPVIRDAAQARNIEEMKRLVVDGAPQAKQLIVSLRKAAPEFFSTITSHPLRRLQAQKRWTIRLWPTRILTASRHTALSHVRCHVGDPSP
jgi:hypothetical protein